VPHQYPHLPSIFGLQSQAGDFPDKPAANPDKLLTKFQHETGMIAKT
jgi:hypothetical protein